MASNKVVDYSGTNAKIDFFKSFDYNLFGGVLVNGCDFSNVDFSWLNLSSKNSEFFRINYSSFDNTKIKFPLVDGFLISYDSSFENVDLFDYEINSWDEFGFYLDLGYLDGCYLNNQLSDKRYLKELKKVYEYKFKIISNYK